MWTIGSSEAIPGQRQSKLVSPVRMHRISLKEHFYQKRPSRETCRWVCKTQWARAHPGSHPTSSLLTQLRNPSSGTPQVCCQEQARLERGQSQWWPLEEVPIVPWRVPAPKQLNLLTTSTGRAACVPYPVAWSIYCLGPERSWCHGYQYNVAPSIYKQW